MFRTKDAPKAKESGFNLIPRGVYEATYEFVDLVETKDGDQMFKWTYQITENSGYLNRKIFDICLWTYAPKSDSEEDIEKAAYTLEQAHGKLGDNLHAVSCEEFDPERPGDVIDILLNQDVLIKIGQREDKRKGEQVNFVQAVYTLQGDHRTGPKAVRKAPAKAPAPPAKPPAPPARPAPAPAQQPVTPQQIIDRQHKSQAAAPRPASPYKAPGQSYRQAAPTQPADEDVPF